MTSLRSHVALPGPGPGGLRRSELRRPRAGGEAPGDAPGHGAQRGAGGGGET